MNSDFKVMRRLCDLLPPAPRVDVLRPVWIFGCGRFGSDVCQMLLGQRFQVRGFIETAPSKRYLLGLPVKRWDQLNETDKSEQLVVGIYNRSTPLDQLEAMARGAGFQDVILPWHLYDQFEKQLGWRYWLSARETIIGRLDALEESHALFTDAISQACLRNIYLFRLGLNTGYGSFRHDDNQYFNALTLNASAPKAIRYVDGGAYNGDTLIELTGLHSISKAYLFEPDKANFDALQKKLGSINVSAYALPLALSDRYQMLSFSDGNGEAGTVNDSGNVHIAATALDSFLPTQSVDFIKLDVEGSEMAALAGAVRLIERCRPTLAISLYHRAQDLWEIPVWLAAHCPEYDFALRQHFFNSFDSVLYAIPRRR